MANSHSFLFLIFFLILFRQAAKCNERNKNENNEKKYYFKIYSFYGFLSAVVIIHKCYQPYCEFRLKMHFVPINM